MKRIETSLENLFRAERAAPELPRPPDPERLARRVADRWVAERETVAEAVLWTDLSRGFARGLAASLVVASVLVWVTWVPVPPDVDPDLAVELLSLLPVP